MSRSLYLVTFATQEFKDAEQRLVESALATGEFAGSFRWDPQRLQADPSFAGSQLLTKGRGTGFWSWKPHIILDGLTRVSEDDAVLYYDAGRYGGGFTIRRSVRSLLDFADRNEGMFPGVLVRTFGPNSRWTKRDCFVYMGCDERRYWEHPQVQATFSLWLNRPRALDFLRSWNHYCLDPRVVGDGPNVAGLPNLTDFVDHRHDQSILTNLVVRLGVQTFDIRDRLFHVLASLTRHSFAANTFAKHVDNISQIAEGANASALYVRELVATTVGGHGQWTPRSVRAST